jgi:hypothetical protein
MVWKTVAALAVVTVGVRGFATTADDASIFSPGVSQTNNSV